MVNYKGSSNMSPPHWLPTRQSQLEATDKRPEICQKDFHRERGRASVKAIEREREKKREI